MPLAPLIARAILRDDCGNSVPEVYDDGPPAGTNPRRATVWDSMPSRHTGMPPTCASHTIAVSAPRHWLQRSSGSESASATARITERMSNGFLRSALWVAEKTSPTVAMSEPAIGVCGAVRTSRSIGSVVARRRGHASPGTT